MNTFFTTLLIGISLSMDAFSLALVYGMTGMKNKEKLLLSLIVGVYHFIMPLIGLIFGTILNKINVISIDIIASLIFEPPAESGERYRRWILVLPKFAAHLI